MSGPGEFSSVVKLSRRLHSWWCPSVNSFKFQPCDQTPPRTQKLVVSRKDKICKVPGRTIQLHTTPQDCYHLFVYFHSRSLVGIVYGWDYDGI